LVALDGPTGILADVNSSSPYRVGKYGVHLHNLEQVGVESLWQAIQQHDVSLVIIDEIGKMELYSPDFCQAVEAALDGAKPVLATVMAGRQPWVDAIKARSGVELVEVTLANRQALPEQVLRWLRGAQAQTTPA
jgi:nucleoside-triphosphatase